MKTGIERPGNDHGRRDATHSLPRQVDVAVSAGSPLDAVTVDSFRARLGHDFSQVRIHADESGAKAAQAQNAEAYTLGSHIFVDAGFSLGTPQGQRLLTHELTHVAQQTVGGSANEHQAEEEAITNANLATGTKLRVLHPVPALTIQRQAKAPKPIPLDAEAEQIIGVLLANPSDKRDRKTEVGRIRLSNSEQVLRRLLVEGGRSWV